MPALETMNLSEYRNHTFDILQDYHQYVPSLVWEDAYYTVITADTEGAITRALKSCRDAL